VALRRERHAHDVWPVVVGSDRAHADPLRGL
jgi:hypothetical protein